MSYIDGFVMAVPNANRGEFISHCEKADSWFIDNGALRVVETWGADVPKGDVTDFHRAVAATEDESVCFSWVEWPDKETRDKAMVKMEDSDNMDERLDPAKNPMPFDGKRMIFGGFEPVFDQSA